MCRANYVPIWEYLVSTVRTEREVELVRANLMVNGVVAVSTRGKEEQEMEKKALQMERDTLRVALGQHTLELSNVQTEMRQLCDELIATEQQISQTRNRNRWGEQTNSTTQFTNQQFCISALSSNSAIFKTAEGLIESQVGIMGEYHRRVELVAQEIREQNTNSQVQSQAMVCDGEKDKLARLWDTLQQMRDPDVLERLISLMQKVTGVVCWLLLLLLKSFTI
jgi:chromosome segregation ATPase